MSFSIESRVPFSTPDLVSFVLALPEEYIISANGISKAVFRRAMRGIVPDSILDRTDKIGFATPEKDWLTTLRPWVERILRSGIAMEIPALKSNVLEEEWKAVLRGRKCFDSRVWRSINLIKWVGRFNVSF